MHAAVPLLFTSIAISTSTFAGAGAGAGAEHEIGETFVGAAVVAVERDLAEVHHHHHLHHYYQISVVAEW